MRPQIAVLSPFSSMEATVNRILKENHLDIFVCRVSSSDIQDRARQLMERGVRIFISRGNLVSLLRENFDIPVVEVRYSFFDAYSAYKKALRLSDKIVFVPLADNYRKLLLTSQEHMPCAKVFAPVNDEAGKTDYRKTVEAIREQGYEVLIGGSSFEAPSIQEGIKYVSNEVSDEAVLEALKEALHLQKVEKERAEREMELLHKYETINAVFNCVSESIVNTDADGIITHMNRSAGALLGNRAMSRSILEILQSQELSQALRNGTPLTNEIVRRGDSSLLLNCEPIIIKKVYNGMVISIQPFTKIQTAERKIRDSILSKGHISQKRFEHIIGTSPAIRSAKALAQQYAAVDSTVLILGETGTGKELFAQSIHSASRRSGEPFVAINCSALPSDVLESELFGYVRGAFTGAKNEGKIGLFELAHKGTLFLDEISDVPLSIQLKLLRVIQERKIMRIGDDKLISIDVRIIVASNKNLLPLVEAGVIREDFYYRICVLELRVPPLRERQEDIPDLIRNFLRRKAPGTHFTEEAVNVLSQCTWPGNVRQLENIVERLTVISQDGTVDAELIRRYVDPDSLNVSRSRLQPRPHVTEQPLYAEKDVILQALRNAGGNREAAAKALHISVATLYRKLKKIRTEDPDCLATIRYQPE